MTGPRTTRTWWQRERMALALLPIALVGALAASSSRVQDYWWDRGFHDPAPVSAAGVATVTDRYDDGYLTYPIEARIALQSAKPVTQLPGSYKPMRVPTGGRLWEVVLRWSADPDIALGGCSVALVEPGSTYVASSLDHDAGAPTPLDPCLPDGTPGPRSVPGSTAAPVVADGEAPRPPRWTSRTYVVTPDDAKPEAVRVWWLLPTYAELPIG